MNRTNNMRLLWCKYLGTELFMECLFNSAVANHDP